MATTLKDIASHLNLSPALVSRVLNDKPGVWASEDTRRRIHHAAREMNYRPSASARALVTGRTMQLAVSAADAEWHKGGSGRLMEVRGLIEAAAEHHYRVLVLPRPQNNADRSQFDSLVHSQGCDGFCIYAEQADAPLYEYFCSQKVPFIIIGNPGNAALPQVDQDNYQQLQSSVAWLHNLGHRRIAMVNPSTRVEAPFQKVVEQGFMDAMQAHGGFDPTLIPERCMSPEEITAFVSGRRAPTAVILTGLASSMNWKMVLQLKGIRVPEDITLLARIDVSEFLHLQEGILQDGMAFMIHDPRQVGFHAGEALIQWINGTRPQQNPLLISAPAPRWWHEVDEVHNGFYPPSSNSISKLDASTAQRLTLR